MNDNEYRITVSLNKEDSDNSKISIIITNYESESDADYAWESLIGYYADQLSEIKMWRKLSGYEYSLIRRYRPPKGDCDANQTGK